MSDNENQVSSPNLTYWRPALIYSGVVFTFMLLLTAWAWGQIPAGEQVPIHWNLVGEVDDYASKEIGLLMLPGITAALILLFVAIPYLEPRQGNLLRSRTAYMATWGGLITLQAGLHLVLVLTALGTAVPMERVAPFAVAVLFIVMGNYLGKVRSNFMFGVRTPWTLSSELSWNKTHRLAGKLFMASGALLLLTFWWVHPQWSIAIILVTVFGLLVATTAYSYWVWKGDVNRR